MGEAKVLVVGTGGLGYEILKDLAMMEGVVRDVTAMDLGALRFIICLVCGLMW